MSKKRKRITLRFDDELDSDKLEKMAKVNKRSLNSEILWAIKLRIKQFDSLNK